MNAAVASLQVGRIAPLGPEGVPSGFVKRAVTRPVATGTLGLAGDEQADLSVHGGPDKAVYAYAASRYPTWAEAFPPLAGRFVGGSMGENLTVTGLDEDNLCVGDVHRIGTALLQVCQPRQPCFKLALAFGEPRLGKHMVRSGHSGWYYAVVREGELGPGDAVERMERPNPDFAFARLVTIVNRGDATPDELARLAEMPGVAGRIAQRARAALDGG